MSLAKEIVEKYGKVKKNEQSGSAIAELKKMDFKSQEDRAKAAQLIKGLLFSSDDEAKEFTKELEDLIDDMEAGPEVEDDKEMDEEEVDFEKSDLLSLWSFIKSRIDRKPPSKQAEYYNDLLLKVLNLAKEMPSGEQKIKTVFKQFRSEM
jgi:hypothetical protein